MSCSRNNLLNFNIDPYAIPNYSDQTQRCPNLYVPQKCIYTSQGILICNEKNKDTSSFPTMYNSDLNKTLNIYQPFYS